MVLEVTIPDSLNGIDYDAMELRMFLQGLVNRRYQGSLRYERNYTPDRRKQYMKRLGMEFRNYRTNGNYEQLLNMAVYCYLESRAPQNRRFHFDPSVGSVTRGAAHGN